MRQGDFLVRFLSPDIKLKTPTKNILIQIEYFSCGQIHAKANEKCQKIVCFGEFLKT